MTFKNINTHIKVEKKSKDDIIRVEVLYRMSKVLKEKKVLLFASVLILAVGIVTFLAVNYLIDNKTKICIAQFNTNGGTEMNSISLECGAKLTKPDDPTKEGFDFVGWYIGDKEINYDELYLNESIVIDALWKVKEGIKIITVSFDTDGGSIVNPIEVMEGKRFNPPLNPQKDGYNFLYWTLNDSRYDFMNQVKENITLKAKWEKTPDISENEKNNKTVSSADQGNQKIDTTEVTLEKCTYEKKNINLEYDGQIPTYQVYLEGTEQFYFYYGFWNYNSNGCNIVYKTKDTSIASVNDSGLVSGNNLGNTKLSICVVDKKSNKELDCFEWNINVIYEPGSQREHNDSYAFVNQIEGYYWYLDGYNNAYIRVQNVDWYDHQYLDWTSEYIDIEDNKFVMTEDTGIPYASSNIHNQFLINPTEYAHRLKEEYNMHVSNNKLYITLGKKTYSFNKENFKRPVKGKISVSNKSQTINRGTYPNFEVQLTPSYADYALSVVSSNEDVLSDCKLLSTKTFICHAANEGTSILTFTDAYSNTQATINVTVKSVHVTGISLDKSYISLLRGSTEKLNATITPSDAENQKIKWNSDNMAVAKVDNNGLVSAVGKGTTVITATSEDGSYTATCEVNVSNPPLTASASIGYQMTFSGSTMAAGISATVSATGGTGKYTYYYLRLYTSDNQLIAQTYNTLANSVFAIGYKNGSYYVTFEVRDSDGNTYSGTSGITSVYGF